MRVLVLVLVRVRVLVLVMREVDGAKRHSQQRRSAETRPIRQTERETLVARRCHVCAPNLDGLCRRGPGLFVQEEAVGVNSVVCRGSNCETNMSERP